ncbi:hypothetical protein CJ030_MR1G001455 [Morella rubra]|uniref:Uncharacterized protein n=1 Tax=Morella rubra TaxID=262757 RepID=A0A6A1WMM7_9ROSI|nr:hypothetical protein CJ030_MR1G001455 [Morella rubra]
MPRTKHAAMVGNERAGSSRSSADHSDFEIERPFVKQGWRNLLDMGNEVFPKYVRIFFSNMTVGWEAGVILGDILGIPHVGIRAYELKTWPVCKGFDYGEALVYLLGNGVAEDAPRKIHANQLPIRSRLLHLICTHNLIPRGGHREEVTFMDVFVIERLLKEKKFNLPYIMLKHMEAACSDEDEDVDEDVAEAEDEPEGEESSDPTSSFDTQFTAFEERMTAMHEAQKKFLQESVTSMQEEQRQFFAEMRTFMARFPPP